MGPVVLDKGRSSGYDRHRAGAGPDLGDHAGGHRGFDDVVAAVVLAGDAVKGLRVAGESADPAVLFPFYRRGRLANVLPDVMEVARTKNGSNELDKDVIAGRPNVVCP